MAISRMTLPTGIAVNTPSKFQESYDRELDIISYGEGNRYPSVLKNLYRNSPTLNMCVNREADFLRGMAISQNITRQDLDAICLDYALFNGFALYVHNTLDGTVDLVQWIDFESLRIGGDVGEGGFYSKIKYCYDWTFTATINKKRITKKDIREYDMYSDDINVRARRAQENGGWAESILYYSSNTLYPISNADAVLSYVADDIAIANILTRNCTSSFLPACVISVNKTADNEFDEFVSNVQKLQGDVNAQKILVTTRQSDSDEVKITNLHTENYDQQFTNTQQVIENKILGTFNQRILARIDDGSMGLGDGGSVISEGIKYYNWQLNAKKKPLIDVLTALDPTFKYEELTYTITPQQTPATV